MTPPPSGEHNVIAAILTRALCSVLDESLGVFQTLGVAVPSASGILIPDLCVVDLDVPRGTMPIASEHVVLAVEITSPSNPNHDREYKRWAYARGGISQYLLIDPLDKSGASIWVFSRPENGNYCTSIRTSFGKSVRLADPVSLDIDSSRFPLL